MTTFREGAPNIADVLRQLGKDAVLREAEAAGLKPRAGRMRCPFEGCRDKGEVERRDTVQIYPGKRGEPRLRCHRCSADGSLVDLIAAVKGWTEAEAIRHLIGLPTPAPRPVRLVQPEPPVSDDKLKPEEIRAVWEQLSTSSEHGEAYLLGRGLDAAVELGLVRFATKEHPSKKVKDWVIRQRLVVALMKDVVGNPRGLQARLVREPVGNEPKISSLKGSSTSKSFFGFPEMIESSAIVAVAEGLADTCALAQWAMGCPVAVVGAAGKDALPKLAEELQRCGIPMEGRIVALFPQNDRPLNKSRASFERLGQLLAKEGARVVVCSTHEEYKDLAEWLKGNPDLHWPPPDLARVLGGEIEHESPATQLVEPPKGGLPIPAQIRVEHFGQDFSTLCALLDDPLHREAIMGRAGELVLNEMDETVWFGEHELKDADLFRIRLGIEQHARSTSGKLLKFATKDIGQALVLLSRRKIIHPVRDWLQSLNWDGLRRMGPQLPMVFGHQPGSLEAVLLEKWLIAAVARALKPGCKVDNVLVLVGKERTKKSTFFNVIAGDEWFTDEQVNREEGKDGKLILRKKWILEWAELEAMNRARSPESVKAFISQRVDLFRAPYERGLIEAPRHCLFVATTNRPSFLAEAHGNRRFWPVRADRVELAWVKANRDQLLAEAVARFTAGEQWWLADEDEDRLVQHNLGHQRDDSWAEIVDGWITVHQPEFVTVRQMLEEAVKKDTAHISKGDDNRMADVLKSLGWTGPVRRFRGAVGRFWLPPGSQLELNSEGGSDHA